MGPLPIGTITLFFTDVEGSTRLLQSLGVAYGPLLAEQSRLLRDAIRRHGGEEVDTQGDALFAVRDLGDERGITLSLNTSGIVARAQGDYPRARAIYQECLERARHHGDRQSEAIALGNLGNVAFNEGDHASAEAMNEEALTVFRETGVRRLIAATLNSLGTVARALGKYEKATSMHEESLVMFKELGDKWGVAEVLTELGCLHTSIGEWVRAAHFFGAAEALRAMIGSLIPIGDRAEYDRSLSVLRERIGEDGLRAAWSKGRSMTLEDMADYALGVPSKDRLD